MVSEPRPPRRLGHQAARHRAADQADPREQGHQPRQGRPALRRCAGAGLRARHALQVRRRRRERHPDRRPDRRPEQHLRRGADTGYTFTLAGTYRYDNDQWHKDRQSSKYRSQTRKGGADALNIWLVDFNYLGIATFPGDYPRNGKADGIRVHWDSLPGGGIANYNLGETATHEAGHWLGLYHAFRGGCTPTNDEVADTPAQGSSSSGRPVGNDTCDLPGLDPIHNHMDYSYGSCYTEFTTGQSDRMASTWTAYRG